MTKVFIFGSCVSRDAFPEANAAHFKVVNYCARSSLASAFSNVVVQGIDVQRLESAFQRRMVEVDVEHRLSSLLEENDYDLLLVDCIDERFDLYIDLQGGICTLSNELLATGFKPAQLTGRIVPSGSDEFFELWERGWERLIDLLRRHSHLDRLRINAAYWSEIADDGGDYCPHYSPEGIRRANKVLSRLYSRMKESLLSHQILEFAPELWVGAASHRWGRSPFHYNNNYYVKMIEQLKPTKITFGIESTVSLLQLAQIQLTENIQWHNVNIPFGATLLLEAEIIGQGYVSDRRALVSVDFGDRVDSALSDGQFTLSNDLAVGPYRYLSTGMGSVKTRFSFTPPENCTSFRIGLRSWWPESDLNMDFFRLSIQEASPEKKVATIISVDVEALLGRANIKHVERLIFGRYGNAPAAGIERLCDIFDSFGARATFFVDYAMCAHLGDHDIFSAAEILAKRGHDVQLHMHSEVLVRKKNWNHDRTKLPAFDVLDRDVARACLEYGIEKFKHNLGASPRIFRPGGMKHSAAMYAAAHDTGIEAVSALFRGYEQKFWPQIYDTAIFQWNNGIKELPLDFALDPLVYWEPFEKQVNELHRDRSNFPVQSMLIHSTSLLIRDRNNNPPFFTGPHQAYEDQLVRYLTWLAEQGGFITYSDLLDNSGSFKTIELDQLYPQDSFKDDIAGDIGKGLQSNVVLTLKIPPYIPSSSNDVEQFVPPTALPIKLAKGQRLDSVEVLSTINNMPIRLAYVLAGYKAYIQCQRGSLPGGEELQEALIKIFTSHPSVDLIIAESVLEDTSIPFATSREVVRKTFVMELPTQFEEFRISKISHQLRKDIEREFRRVNDIFPDIQFRVLSCADMGLDDFSRAAQVIEDRLSRKVDGGPDSHGWSASNVIAQWDLYRRLGSVVELASNEHVFAVALCLENGNDCYIMASGQAEHLTKYSFGKILLYLYIEKLIKKGMKRLHLGGGDFGYKRRFGADERLLHTFHFTRASNEPLSSRVIRALEYGVSPTLLEADIEQSLEVVLGKAFESQLEVDFDTIVENRNLGTDMNAARYQATLREAFFTLMNSIVIKTDDIFCDVGCGKGKMLYYASQLGYRKCIGIELSDILVQQAYKNIKKLQLNSEVELLQRDASCIPAADLSDVTVFYLYNPFSEIILSGFLKNVVESQKLYPRRVLVVYCNARYDAPFYQFGFKLVRLFETGVDDWRFDQSIIFQREPI
jgi:16S rRNA G966 N2-methylase RsmD